MNALSMRSTHYPPLLPYWPSGKLPFYYSSPNKLDQATGKIGRKIGANVFSSHFASKCDILLNAMSVNQ